MRMLFRLLGDNSMGGHPGPPNSWATSRWIKVANSSESLQIAIHNDGSEVWIGSSWDNQKTSEWAFYTRADAFRKLALWYLWRWAWGEWFGLRPALYFWVLHRQVASWKRQAGS